MAPTQQQEGGGAPFDWKKSAAKKLLQKALKDGDVPIDYKEMGPKVVYEKYENDPVFEGMQYNDAFRRRLLALRKQAADGEDEKIDWKKHPGKQFLKQAFKEGTIPFDYSMTIGPREVWDTHCKNHPALGGAGMKYGTAFTRRLGTVCTHFCKQQARAIADQECFDLARKNHPIKTHNHRGELRWAGSEAQRLLKQDMKEGKHVQYFGHPQEFRATRPEYQEYAKETFRKHIHQEKRLWKFKNFVRLLEEEKNKDMGY